MTERNHTPRRMRAAGAAISGLVLLAAACTTELPTAAAIDEMDVEQARERAEVAGLLMPTPDRNPLFIVDGVIVSEDAATEIASLEIGSIEVIKGPAAVQAYGERAEHGAILIRTRSADGADAAIDEVRASFQEVKTPLGEPLERAAVLQRRAAVMQRRAAGSLEALEFEVEKLERSSVEFEASAVEMRPLTAELYDNAVEMRTRAVEMDDRNVVLEAAAVDSPDRRGVLRLRRLQEAPPLFIVDGVIVGSSFSLDSLSPESIESIEVVKGAAARTLYSDARAQNGVIRITTKSGGR